jgi:hypothetical protein
MNSSRIIYQPRRDATTEGEASVLAAIYKFVLFDSQIRRGGPHDLTDNSIDGLAKNGPQNTEQEKT